MKLAILIIGICITLTIPTLIIGSLNLKKTSYMEVVLAVNIAVFIIITYFSLKRRFEIKVENVNSTLKLEIEKST